MTAAMDYTIFQDEIELETGTVQLVSNGEQSFVLPANGATYRFETQQVPHHPIPTPLFASIEGCGRNESGGFSLEHITNFSLAETNPFYSIHCEPNRGSFDPNDKRGFPVGYGPLEYIEQDLSLIHI